MTREEKIKAFEMRLDGYTFEEIGKAFGVSKQAVNQALGVVGTGRKGFSCIYPNIKRWITDNKMSCKEFSNKVGFSNHAAYLWFAGKTVPTKTAVDAILKVTGMTYEEAFATETAEVDSGE